MKAIFLLLLSSSAMAIKLKGEDLDGTDVELFAQVIAEQDDTELNKK